MPTDKERNAAIHTIGQKLALALPGFYGRVTFNYQNGVYANSNVEQSIKPDNLKKGVENEHATEKVQ